MEGPANTLSYMIAGYAVIFTVNIVYLASLIIRWRNLRQDQEMLEQMDHDKEKSYDSASANIKPV
jgi:hypothetical protein